MVYSTFVGLTHFFPSFSVTVPLTVPAFFSPPQTASFLMNMLAGTPAGDAYTFKEIGEMLTSAGFGAVTRHPLHGPETVVVATRA